MAKNEIYPADFNPPNRGICLRCGCETMAYSKQWTDLCPQHWQELDTNPGALARTLSPRSKRVAALDI
jgi:hypothetical protein